MVQLVKMVELEKNCRTTSNGQLDKLVQLIKMVYPDKMVQLTPMI